MKMMKTIRLLAFAAAVLFAALGGACVQGPPEKGDNGKPRSGKIRIGISMDTLKEERWRAP